MQGIGNCKTYVGHKTRSCDSDCVDAGPGNRLVQAQGPDERPTRSRVDGGAACSRSAPQYLVTNTQKTNSSVWHFVKPRSCEVAHFVARDAGVSRANALKRRRSLHHQWYSVSREKLSNFEQNAKLRRDVMSGNLDISPALNRTRVRRYLQDCSSLAVVFAGLLTFFRKHRAFAARRR